VETALHSFFVSLPLAVAVWLVVLLALAAAVTAPRRPSPPPDPRAAVQTRRRAAASAARPAKARPATAGPAGRPATAVDVAGRAAVAERADATGRAAVAERAAAVAARHREQWIDAQERLDAAWTAFDAADRAARRTHAATAYPLLSRRRKLGDNAERERYLHHAATVACRQREISIAQLNEVFAHRGWNPRLHPVVQEAALRNAIRAHRFADYCQVQRQERAAWEAAEHAAELLRAARAEAAAVVDRTAAPRPVAGGVRWTEQWSTQELPAVA
jgi:hypothetical protein